MTKTHSSPDTRAPAQAEGPSHTDLFGGGIPVKKRAGQARRELFEKYHFTGLAGNEANEDNSALYPAGMDGVENDPEVYPVHQAAGQTPNEHEASGTCEVCGKSKVDCTC